MIEYRDLLGTKYKVHGRSKEEGFDCWGVAIELYKRAGRKLVDIYYETLDKITDIEQEIFSLVPSEKIDRLEDMCIIMINVKGEPVHIGVYVGNGMFIHAVRKLGVIVEPVSRWKNRIEGLYKVKD